MGSPKPAAQETLKMYRRALRTASVGFMSPTVRATACGFGCLL